MDRGEAFRRDLSIRPAEEGSFVVSYGGGSSTLQYRQYGFSNVSDLLDWLVAHAQAFSADKIAADVTHELTEGEVVKEGPSLRERFDARYGTTLGNILDSGKGNLRRTSAAERMFPGTGMSAADMKEYVASRQASTEPKPAA